MNNDIWNRKVRSNLIKCGSALILTVCVLVLLGTIPKWGSWYSSSLYYHLQTDRLIQGEIALSEDPSGMRWDLAWAGGKIQQVWGLGIPLLRLPFELIARLVGASSLGDRVVFATVYFIVTYALLGLQSRHFREAGKGMVPARYMLTLYTTILFPPFLALCSSRFLVYEESVGYGFVLSLLLMVWTVSLWIEPRKVSFLGLALVSGLLPFVRPTFVFYSIASTSLAALSFSRKPNSTGLILCGAVLFTSGIALLLWSNTLRFGHCFEFGHSLNLNSDDAMRFASRFDYPFHAEPFIPAAHELFALLFQTRSLLTSDPYGNHLFPGQSPTFRWRELYFSTYDISIFTMVIVVWIWLLWRLYRRLSRRQLSSECSIVEVASLWSLFGVVPLLVLYLRFPFISSRYLLDFGPGFAVGCWAFILLAMFLLERLGRNEHWVGVIALTLFSGWWGYEMVTIDSAQDKSDSAGTWKRAAIQSKAYFETRPSKAIPQYYTNGFHFATLGIPFNGSGWDQQTGIAAASVAFFVKDPNCLILELAPASSTPLQIDSYRSVQAKIGLELLQLATITPTARGMQVIFNGPQKRQYQNGIQVAFLGLVRPAELSGGNSLFRLLKVSWHEDNAGRKTP